MFFWESLTKNLVTFNFNILRVHWKFFFRGEGAHRLKGEIGKFADLTPLGRRGLVEERGCFLPDFRRQGACYDITKFEDFQTSTKK